MGKCLNRPLTGEWLWMALCLAGRRLISSSARAGRIVSVAAIIAVVANSEGRREIIELGVGPSNFQT